MKNLDALTNEKLLEKYTTQILEIITLRNLWV